MVSEWMKNRNIKEFVKAHPDWNRPELVRFLLMAIVSLTIEDVITVAWRRNRGADLHARPGCNPWGSERGTCLDPIVVLLCPDLANSKANILINNNCQPCLADFANLNLLGALSDQTSASIESDNAFSETIRWMSPELLDPDAFGLKRNRPTKESDCYALGMVMYEVLTGRAPFASLKDFMIARMVLDGKRPERPSGALWEWFPGSIWEMLGHCWAHQPNDRPGLDAVLLCLQHTAQQWIPPPDTETDSDNQSCITANRPGVSSMLC